MMAQRSPFTTSMSNIVEITIPIHLNLTQMQCLYYTVTYATAYDYLKRPPPVFNFIHLFRHYFEMNVKGKYLPLKFTLTICNKQFRARLDDLSDFMWRVFS